jgi:chromosomal replication initiator protein
MNVAHKPGAQFYNPLFVFGHSGLGKTHLVNALGMACVKAHPELNVLYLTANDFLNFMQRAVMEQKIPELLSYYQSVDVFIIDDIQEIGGNKTATQDLFFNVFNHLYQSGKQVVITADKAPKDIQGFEQRILSRFKWGLQAELTSPDFDLKYSILKEKTKEQGVEIPDDVLRFVAERVPDNLRELDGVIASILAQSMFLGAPINIELASRIVSDMVTFREKTLSISDIQEKVCDYYKLSVNEIQTKSRKRDVVQARQIAMYLARKYTKSSLTVIGEQIGNRDHATVLHAVKTVMDLCETDREIRESVSTIEKELK